VQKCSFPKGDTIYDHIRSVATTGIDLTNLNLLDALSVDLVPERIARSGIRLRLEFAFRTGRERRRHNRVILFSSKNRVVILGVEFGIHS
jgi:hypothetical protein